MREAFARRDIGTVYTKLGHRGVSQRRIAALTGQSQSEISEIIAGRQVTSIALLERIADGLGVPRAWLGLGNGISAQTPTAAVPPTRRTNPAKRTRDALTPAPLAEDSPAVQLAVRAFLTGLLMSDALDPFRDPSPQPTHDMNRASRHNQAAA
jgi:transcriptional regulator with XRE-family HTH domain